MMVPRFDANRFAVHAPEGQTSSSPPPLRLQIVAEMSRRNFPAFYESSTRYIDLVQSANLTLLLSGWKVKGDVVRFFNFWDMTSDANTLVRAELELPDDADYAGFASLFTSEVKDIALPINAVRVVPDPPDDRRYVYMRVAYKVLLQNFAEFSARIESSLVLLARDNGWRLGDVYLGVTGGAESIVQMWIIPESQIADAPQMLGHASWLSLLADNPTYDFLEPIPADPILGIRRGILKGTAYASQGYSL